MYPLIAASLSLIMTQMIETVRALFHYYQHLQMLAIQIAGLENSQKFDNLVIH
jgi:hypothetical protein